MYEERMFLLAIFYVYGFESCPKVDTVLCVMVSDKAMLLVGILHV